MSHTTDSLLPDSFVERAMVARGWAEIDAAERLGVAGTERELRARYAPDRARAQEWFEAPGFALHREGYESATNVVRYRKTCDYLNEGESVYEVGIGKGFLALMMMREGKLGGYRGVDLVESNVRDTTHVLRENGFGDRANVGVQDLYDLTREDVDRAGATLLVCCEVIEHVPDPEGALRALADALPEGTDLLWSVPLLGRLEGIWGHTAIFGARRVQEMLTGAGLVAHHVEVVENQWAFVLSSRSARPSPRAEAAVRAITAPRVEDLVEPPARSVTNVAPSALERLDPSWTRRVDLEDVDPPEDVATAHPGAICVEARPTGTEGSRYGGVAIACPEGIRGIRVQLGVSDQERVSRLYVEFSRKGELLGRWTWRVDTHRTKHTYPTFVLRPGATGIALRRDRSTAAAEGADRVEVFMKLEDEEPARLTVVRWAWVS